MNIISIGEVLWDVFEDAEHIGGATFNFCAHAARLGHDVSFVSAVGRDELGRRAIKRTEELGLSTEFIRETDEHPTGYVSVFVDSKGQPDFTIHRPAAYDFPQLDDGQFEKLSEQNADWIYFGTLFLMGDQARSLTERVLGALPTAQRIYDINLRKGSYTPALIHELLGLATILKINDEEVFAVRKMSGEAQTTLEGFAREYADRFGLEGVCITKGSAGCSILLEDEFVEVAGYPVEVADAVGAGDAFTAAFVHGLGGRWSPEQIGDFANRVGALVASRSGAVPDWTLEEAEALG